MVGPLLYTSLIALTGLERLVELVVARRNAAWSFSRGGVEYGSGHWPPMVLLHTGLLVGCVVEIWWARPDFNPMIGWPMFGLVVACQILRWWCIHTLGTRWNPRVIVIPNAPRIHTGPYRWMSHPNYVAVALEGIALPMVYGAWRTAAMFTAFNALMMVVRIRCENAALQSLMHEER